MYLKGEGCIFDIEKARNLITKSSDQGNKKAKQILLQGLPVLSTPKSTHMNNHSDDVDEYNDNEDDEDENDEDEENINNYSSSKGPKEKDQILFEVFQSLEKRIKKIHRKMTVNFLSSFDALNDIDFYFVDKNLSKCVSEFTTARDSLIKAEDKAYLEISKEKQRKNRLPRLKRDERGQISLNDPDGFLSLSEINFNSPTPVDDDSDDELYKLGMEIRTLETRLDCLDKQIQNSKKPFFVNNNDFLSASSSSSASTPRNQSNGKSFDNLFGYLDVESASSASGSRKNYPTPPNAPPTPKSPYQTRIKRFSNK